MKLSQSLSLLIDRAMPETKQRQIAADYARGVRDGLIAKGLASRHYTTEVDGRQGAAEETVRLDGGRIVYNFSGFARAVEFVLDYLRERSPVLTGEYRRSWVVLVDGALWSRPFEEIPDTAEVVVTNDRPFHRLIEAGSNYNRQSLRTETRKNRRTGIERMRVLGATEDAMRLVRERFPEIAARRQFVSLAGGKPDVPYTTKAGMTVTYPAVVMRLGNR